MKITLFKKNTNYIGNKKWMYKWTDYVSKKYPEVNYTAYKHDRHYEWVLTEKYIIVRLVLKLMYDLIFLVLGAIRNVLKIHPNGVIIIFVLWICLTVYTPWWLHGTRKQIIDLSKK